jgi:hypothetical protein
MGKSTRFAIERNDDLALFNEASQKTPYQRFAEAAHELGIDATEDTFNALENPSVERPNNKPRLSPR